MKYIKLFENFSYGELEDNILELIETGMVEKSETGENFQEIKLVKKSSTGVAWIPTHYSIKFKLNIRTVLTSIEDLEFNKKLYDDLIEIVHRTGGEFKLSAREFTLFVPCGDSIKNFFRTWGTGPNFIDFDPQITGVRTFDHHRIVSACSVHKIEDDFSVIFRTWTLRNYTLEEGLNFVKGVVESETEYKYNAEVWGQDLGHIKDIYIRVKPL